MSNGTESKENTLEPVEPEKVETVPEEVSVEPSADSEPVKTLEPETVTLPEPVKKEPELETAPAETVSEETVPEPVPTTETQATEPENRLALEEEPETEKESTTAKERKTSKLIEPEKEQKQVIETTQPEVKAEIIYQTPPNLIQKLLVKARATIKFRKIIKLNKIMRLYDSKPHLTNEDVQKLLRVTDRTARRYFDELEKENRVKQVGEVGRGVFYEKIR
jgi:predicted HTH transcriptional regulator